MGTALPDEIWIHLVPVLLGSGKPLFGGSGIPAELEPVQVIEAPGVTHLRFRVLR
jgi:dihydrofolate reductase